MRYIQRVDGEWIDIDAENYYIRCCDCGLVHRLKFRLVGKNHKIQFQAFRIKKRKNGQH